jgi:HEAT repeat protein
MNCCRPVNPSWDNSGGSSLNDAVLLAISNLARPEREQAIERAAETADPEQLVGLISTDDAIRRNAAMEALARGGRRSVPALVKALEDQDPEVVMFAATTLGKTRDLSAIPHLARALQHGDINVCHAVVETLGCLRAVAALDALSALLDGDPWLRFAVVHTLGEIGHPSSVPTLVGLLRDADVRDTALTALGKIGGIAAVGELVQRLEASGTAAEFRVCLEALGNALAEVADPAVLQQLPPWTAFVERASRTVAPRLAQLLREDAALTDSAEPSPLREAIIELSRCLRVEACYPLLVSLAAHEHLHEPLLFAAADLGPALAPHLVSAAGHSDARVRRFACRALAESNHPAGNAALVPLLRDADPAIRAAAVRGIGRLQHTDALPEVVARLGDESTLVRGAAGEALSRMDARLVTLALLRDAQAVGKPPRLALAIMQANPHPLQRGFLEACLADASPDIRQAAVAALAAQRGTDVADALEPTLADPALPVRRAAVGALSERPSERTRRLLLERLERDAELRGDIFGALGRIGDPRAIARIVSVFRSCTPAEQTLAVDALGIIDSPSVEPFLCRQLGNPDPRVRRHSVRALVQIGSATALRRVVLAARDSNPRVRLALSKALVSCPHPTARQTLERLSVDPDATVAAAAGVR